MCDRIKTLLKQIEDLIPLGPPMDELSEPSKGEIFTLRYLLETGRAVAPSELSKVSHSSNARISKVLGSLEKKGMISRAINLKDRRFVLVSITDAGKERCERIINHLRQHLTAAFNDMGIDNAEEFVRLLKLFFKSFVPNMPSKADLFIDEDP